MKQQLTSTKLEYADVGPFNKLRLCDDKRRSIFNCPINERHRTYVWIHVDDTIAASTHESEFILLKNNL
jgi:hypothetical protein